MTAIVSLSRQPSSMSGSVPIPHSGRQHKRRSCRRGTSCFNKVNFEERDVMKRSKRICFASVKFLVLLLGVAGFSAAAWGDTEYYRHVLFDNSLTPDSYFYSSGMANGSSFLELKGRRLPVETKTFLTPPNALRLRWQSQATGGWEAEIRVQG